AYGAFPVDIIAVSYEFLEKRGGKTSHITSAHAFAVTGRPDLTIDGLQNPGLWGKAYVCDPWQGFAYPAIKLKQFLYCGDDIRQGERTFSPAPGDTASFCSDPKRFESFRVDLRLKSEKDLPAELLETWRSRLGEIPN
ncbi:MAG: hypothetical protein OQK77_05020, partial [Psychromonas sp.]|nr:hypothetical protein [Psychromonas sp.]